MNKAIKGLGELALRCNDLEKMTAFYRDVVGLEIYNQDVPGLVFLRMGDAVEGHPQLFALFDRDVEVGQATTTLDHFAFLIDLPDYESERRRLEGLGIPLFPREFPHFHWRSLFFADPEATPLSSFATTPPSRKNQQNELMALPVTAADVDRAAAAIAGHVIRTPTTASRTLSEITGADVVIKFENLQFTASYKERGALFKLLSLSDEECAAGVVTMSAGNFGQALAYHATRLGIAVTVVMPQWTPNIKAERTSVLGAEVVLHGEDVDDAAAHAERLAMESLRVLVPPFDDAQVIAGQGTVATEMLDDAPDLEILVVPVGGGGLLAGMSVAARERAPGVELVGVQSEVYPSMVSALAGAEPPKGGPTIAEGIAVRNAGCLTTDIIRALGPDVITVTEAHIEEAVALYLEIEKVVAEGAGAAALAALLEHPQRFRGRRVGLVLSGGNIDLHLLGSVIMRSLVRTGRLVTIRVTVPDLPGSLSRVTALVGAGGGNILDVQHRRHILAVPSRAAQLYLTVEVANRASGESMIERIRAAGFEVEDVPGGLA